MKKFSVEKGSRSERKGQESFQESLSILDKKSRTELLVSPFSKEGEVITLEVEEMPKVAAIADPHMVGSQPSSGGIDAMASAKRRVLGFIKPVRDRARFIDGIARYAYREALKKSKEVLNEGDVFMILGDTVISTEASNAFSGFSTLERSLDNLNHSIGDLEENISVFNLVGNHYSFTGIEKKDYDKMSKKFKTVDNETFKDLVSAVKSGYSWETINMGWLNYRNQLETPQQILHPLQKWYLEKLTFGSQIGRYKKEGEPGSQVVFLDNLIERGGKSEDVIVALNELGMDEQNPLHNEILEYQRGQEEKQKKLIEKMFEDSQKGVKTVVYTHWPELMQDQLIKYAYEQNVGKQEGREWTEEIAKSFVEDNIDIWGGHRHLGEFDLVKSRKGVTWVKSITREFVSFLVQQPHIPSKGMLIATTKDPFSNEEIDYPELVVGPLDEPKAIPVGHNIKRDFNKRLQAIKDSAK